MPQRRDVTRSRRLWWSLSLIWGVMTSIVVLGLLGPDGLPKENGKTGTPWYGFVAVGFLGCLFALIGGHGAATRRAMSATDDDREFLGWKAVLIGGLQCVAGGTAIGFAIYGLAFCESW